MTSNEQIMCGPCIITKYVGATDHKGSRVKATFKDGGDTFSAIVPYEDSEGRAFKGDGARSAHYNAAAKLISKIRLIDRFVTHKIVACGHDDNAYYWVLSNGYVVEAK